MSDAAEEARELLARAVDVLDGRVHVPQSQRTRAAAHLGRQALEVAIILICASLRVSVAGTRVRTRLIVLATLGPRSISEPAQAAWNGLSRCAHRHAYELPPSDPEIRDLLNHVARVVEGSLSVGRAAARDPASCR